MSQDGPTWTEKAHEGLPPAAPTSPESGLRRPPRRALEKEKDQRLCKGLDEVILHAGSPFGDGGFNRFAQSAGPAFIRYWPRRYANKVQEAMQPYTEEG